MNNMTVKQLKKILKNYENDVVVTAHVVLEGELEDTFLNVVGDEWDIDNPGTMILKMKEQ